MTNSNSKRVRKVVVDKAFMPSMADVARACGVSRPVVSAILAPRAAVKSIGFSEETRRRVERAVRRMGYRVSRTALNIRHRRHGMIGILARSLSSVPSNGSVDPVVMVARKFNLLVTIERVDPDSSEWPLFLQENVVDGLMIFDDLGPAIHKEIRRLAIPSVCVNANARGTVGTIAYDEIGAMETAVAHFVERDRLHVGMIFTDEGFWNEQRRAGLQAACHRRHLSPPRTLSLPFHKRLRDDQGASINADMTEFMRSHPSLNAVVLQNDYLIPDFRRACLNLGKQIPADVAVLSMGRPIRMDVEPAISRLLVNDDGTWTGTELLCQWLDGKRASVAERRRTLKYDLVLCGST